MIYGVKVIHTHMVGEDSQRFYEELILRVEAQSFDEAYEKARKYMQDANCEYTNIYGEKVKTFQIEAIDCFLAFDAEADVQELYSSFSTNRYALTEDEYYEAITSPCSEKDLHPLRNKEFN
ncbi:MAG: DUF4288 domain-containing protein [Ruminococcus sp.]|nr:DUF4288 domain-containing protein [Ruminococcus sp.]